jgi:hypothetical protein
MTEPVEQVWTVKHPDSLTMAELDEILSLTGIDITGEGLSWGKVCAALVVWTRRRAGEQVTFDEVYTTLTNKQFRVTNVDPTNG